MQLLVSGAMPTVEKLAQLGTAHLGAFWTPATGNSLDRMEGWGLPYGIDNGCFVLRSDNSPANRRKVLDGFMRYVWVKHWERKAGPVFVAVPDVVGSHAGTLRSFCGWWPMLSPLDLPLAFVAQNGATPANIPWDLFPALFVGGTADDEGDEWKISPAAAAVMHEAKRRGKWVHVGRVNSRERVRWCVANGADSVDGSGFSYHPDTNIPKGLDWIAEAIKDKEGGRLSA
jgi:hypothetical protein